MAAPAVSADDIAAFHAKHFSASSVNHFAEQFLGPVEEEYEEYAEEDDLGYYEDGTKRTLTDEQIAIFRHSEIQTLLRQRRHAAEAKEDEEDDGEIREDVPNENESRARADPVQEDAPAVPAPQEEDLEDGELEEEQTPQIIGPPTPPFLNKGKSKSKSKKDKAKAKKAREPVEKGFFKQNVKPDLRKRTWDKVETGLESLDYDEGESSAAPARPTQRRRISYDD